MCSVSRSPCRRTAERYGLIGVGSFVEDAIWIVLRRSVILAARARRCRLRGVSNTVPVGRGAMFASGQWAVHVVANAVVVPVQYANLEDVLRFAPQRRRQRTGPSRVECDGLRGSRERVRVDLICRVGE
jgi:hypothetical protein